MHNTAASWSRSDINDCKENFNISLELFRDDTVLGCVFAVVTAGKQLIRGSERIVVFSAISKQTSRSSLSPSPHRHHRDCMHCAKPPETSPTVHQTKTMQRYEHGCRPRKEHSVFSLSDLLIPAPPGSIQLLLAALMGLKSINPEDYLAATDTWGQGSWTPSAGRLKEKSCSWVEVRQPEEQLIPRRAQMSNKASATTLIVMEVDEHPNMPYVFMSIEQKETWNMQKCKVKIH